MIRAVIFDMDGVIIDTEKYYCRFWMEAARAAGYDWTIQHSLMMRSLAAEYAEPAVKAIFGDSFDYRAIREERKRRMNAFLADHPIEKKPGIDELLAYLGSHYYRTAIATATNETRAMDYLERVGLLGEFDELICAQMVAHGKPSPDIYRYACEVLKEKPEDCIAIEDSPNGIRAAYAAGLKPVMVPDLSQPDEELGKILYAKADILTDIIKLL